MAPRNKYTKEEMVKAAMHVVRERGIDVLTAKALASELGVYTIDEAKREVCDAAEKVYDAYVTAGLQMQPPFLGVGMQYIRFAKEEPQLYRLLFLSMNGEENSSVMESLRHSQDLVREPLQQTYQMDAQTADRYFRDMWLVVHSLATLIVTRGCPYSEQEMGEILTGFSVSLCKAIKEIPGFAENHYDRDKIFSELVEKTL